MSKIKASKLKFEVNGQSGSGYLAAPQEGGPGVIVLHAWWGLNTFFQELGKRFAAQGFTAFAPDLNQGEIAKTIEAAQEIMNRRNFELTRALVASSVDTLLKQPGVQKGKLGVVGFSMGAAWALNLASLAPDDIAAVVLFYGVERADFTQIRAACQGHYAEDDEWDPVDWARQMEGDMRAAGVQTSFFFYPGAGHWFFEEDRPDAYHAAAAQQAWERTIAFLTQQIGR
jgi:carboxymethylenebutenolidase